MCISKVSSVYVVLAGSIEVIGVDQERIMAPMCKYEGPNELINVLLVFWEFVCNP